LEWQTVVAEMYPAFDISSISAYQQVKMVMIASEFLKANVKDLDTLASLDRPACKKIPRELCAEFIKYFKGARSNGFINASTDSKSRSAKNQHVDAVIEEVPSAKLSKVTVDGKSSHLTEYDDVFTDLLLDSVYLSFNTRKMSPTYGIVSFYSF
jgi:hypothetical protein